MTISDLVEMHSQRLESDRRGELNSTVEKKGFFAPAAKLLRPCTTMIISSYTVIIMCHFLLQIITMNSLNRTQEQPFDSVLVLCSALWTWTKEIGLLMMLYKYTVFGQKFQNVETMSVTDGLQAKRIEKLNNSEKKNC